MGQTSFNQGLVILASMAYRLLARREDMPEIKMTKLVGYDYEWIDAPVQYVPTMATVGRCQKPNHIKYS